MGLSKDEVKKSRYKLVGPYLDTSYNMKAKNSSTWSKIVQFEYLIRPVHNMNIRMKEPKLNTLVDPGRRRPKELAVEFARFLMTIVWLVDGLNSPISLSFSPRFLQFSLSLQHLLSPALIITKDTLVHVLNLRSVIVFQCKKFKPLALDFVESARPILWLKRKL